MQKPTALLPLFSLTNIILVLLNNISLVNSNGLTIKLIHPNSPESPFFQIYLSHEKRIKMLASQSNMRANYLSRTPSSAIHALVDEQHYHYVVKIGIGTFNSKPPYKEYYLEMDTGSGLIWLQCDGCTKCFKQTPAPFPKDKSSSFHPILRQNKRLHYECKYADRDSTHGILARETFYLKTKKEELAKLENIQFGCGLHNKMQFWDYRNNKIAGIMGLGWEDISFVKQLGYKSKGKFSYCLPVLVSGKKTPNTYLRFGDDIVHNKNTKSTPLYKSKNEGFYHVELQGISINGTRLKISPQVFAIKNNNSRSGCIFDTGTHYSRIITPAFQILKLELEKYFSRSKGLKKIQAGLGLELCYERSKAEGFKNLPDITLHFQGSQADFVLKAEAAFEVVNQFRLIKIRECVCLAMMRDDEMSTIGASQQTNHRIMYDTKNKKLVFHQEDCSKNP
ncbi:aspartic proteinase nepenthesin-1 [Phtheirospermum japonicum]|uniref:Aspartic proteinase nepenthesin-1 n=1 Tax=Phtheirospermum japonicum TaxID=374723 RepID=A0A830D0G5_9LAMI|nr:aspartic proteinase nepenthesin-1 [Phtheirospermum japonicum]